MALASWQLPFAAQLGTSPSHSKKDFITELTLVGSNSLGRPETCQSNTPDSINEELMETSSR
jgi:hypothetical protein